MSTAALLAAAALALQAAGQQTFAIAAGPADHAVNRLAAQAGIDVVITADLRGRRTRGLSGRMATETALERLLRPLGARAVRIGPDMYRIEVAPTSPVPRPAPPEPTPVQRPLVTVLSEVVVTAMPPVGSPETPGRRLIDPGALERVEGAASSDGLADLSATVDSTRQGTGRNKLFIRGLADSAMNGPLQATVGQYYGDLRMSFGSPDPDLSLVDISRVEVFEGPQGSRFGTGSIGGVLRLHPIPPQLEDRSLRLVTGASLTSAGGDGAEATMVGNLPIGSQAAGRAVFYARREGGILPKPAEGDRETDAVDTSGARASLRWSDDAWTIDLVGVAQRVAADDSQSFAYGETGADRNRAVLEPYESTLLLAGVTARRRLGRASITSATSLSRQTLEERFDASRPGVERPAAVDRLQTATTIASELRTDLTYGRFALSGGGAVAVGETLVTRRHRDLWPSPPPTWGVDLRRTFAEATLFGEASVSPTPRWRVAIGGRLSAVRIESELWELGSRAADNRDRGGATVRFTPSLSARWNVSERTVVFARFEQLVRPAGLGEANGAFERYKGDRVTLIETGARSRTPWNGLSGELSAGWVEWRDVQADVVTPGGDLVTDNVGDGTIAFVSFKGAWSPTPWLDISGGLFINDSSLTPTRPSVIGGGRTDIPNVAPVGAQLSIDQDAGRLLGQSLRLGADLRYVGHSRLGVGPALDVPQGGYLRSELTARLGDDRRAATLRVSNPFDTAGVRYGIGSPYQLYAPRVVPVRPLTVRLTLDVAF